MGYTISASMGPDGGYRLEAGSELPPLLFDDDQTVAVAVALRVAPVLGAGIGEAAVRALGTIRQVMPSRLRHRLDALEVTALPRPGAATPVDVSLETLVALASTIRDRETVRFDYPARDTTHSPDRALPPRRVEPYHLATSGGRWYLLGWDLDRDDWRLYSADRVRPRTPHGPRFRPREVPGGDLADFVAARFKGATTDAWPCRGSVVLHVCAGDVIPFAGDGTVTPIGPDTCTLEAGSWSWGSLAAAFGRFEVPMEVIEPPELAAAFVTLAERCRAASAGVPGGGGIPSLPPSAAPPSSGIR